MMGLLVRGLGGRRRLGGRLQFNTLFGSVGTGGSMNKEQILGMLRHLLPLIGGMAIGTGYISQEDWAIFSDEFLKVAGPALTFAGLVWTYFDKTDTAIVAKAIALDDVAKVECCDTKEGAALAESVPHQDVKVQSPGPVAPIYARRA